MLAANEELRAHRAKTLPAVQQVSALARNERGKNQNRRDARARRADSGSGCPASLGWSCGLLNDYDLGEIGTASSGAFGSYDGSDSGSTSTLSNLEITTVDESPYDYVYQSESGPFDMDLGINSQNAGCSAADSDACDSGVIVSSSPGDEAAQYSVEIAAAYPGIGGQTIFVDYKHPGSGETTVIADVPLDDTASISGSAPTCEGADPATCQVRVERTEVDGEERLFASWSAGSLYGSLEVGTATEDSASSSAVTDFDDISLSTDPPSDEAPIGCPPTYLCGDSGNTTRFPSGGSQWFGDGSGWSGDGVWTLEDQDQEQGIVNGGSYDNEHFVSTAMVGDGLVSAQVGPGSAAFRQAGEDPPSAYGTSEQGVMIRGSSRYGDDAAFVAAFVTTCHGVEAAYRSSAGAAASVYSVTTLADCTDSSNEFAGCDGCFVQLRVVRDGGDYFAQYFDPTADSGAGAWETVVEVDGISSSDIGYQAAAGPFVADGPGGDDFGWANFSDVTTSSNVPPLSELIGQGTVGTALCSCNRGDPVNAYTGNYMSESDDISIPGRGLTLGFSRTYNALDAGEAASTLSPHGNLGPGWTDSFNMFSTADSSGDVTVQQEDGSAVLFSYDSDSGSYTPPRHVLESLEPNTGEALAPDCPSSALVLTRQDGKRFAFYEITDSPPDGQPSGALCEEIDRNGYETKLSYTGEKLTAVTAYTTLSTTSGAPYHELDFTYRTSGDTSEIAGVTCSADADSCVQQESFGYHDDGSLATAGDGDMTHYGYNTEDVLDQIQTPDQYAASNPGTVIGYDQAGRVTYTQDPAAYASDPSTSRTTYTYNCDPNPNNCGSSGVETTTITDADGNETNEVYVGGLMTSRTEGVGTDYSATWNYAYDPYTFGSSSVADPEYTGGTLYTNWYPPGSSQYGNVQCRIDGDGDVTSYTYNSMNEVLTEAAPDEQSVSTDGSCNSGTPDHETAITYDSNGNLLTRVEALDTSGDAATTTYTYGDSSLPGDVTEATDANGNHEYYEYGDHGNLEQMTDGASDVTAYTHDDDGWLTSVTEPDGNVTGGTPADYTMSYTYSDTGDPLTATDPGGEVVTRGYDADHNLTSVEEQRQTGGSPVYETTHYSYDLDGRRTCTRLPDKSPGCSSSAVYDPAGNVIQKADAYGNTTMYAYDPLNHLESASDPEDNTTQYYYDPLGNLIGAIDADGNPTWYWYDGANRLVETDRADGGYEYLYYDADGNATQSQDGNGNSTYSTYNLADELTSQTDGAGNETTYTDKPMGQPLTIDDADGNTTTYGYDSANRLVTTSVASTGYSSIITDTTGYDADGNVVSQEDGNGSSHTTTYGAYSLIDGTDLPSSQTDPDGHTSSYAYDGQGNLTSLTKAAGGVTSYSYDPASRLSGISYDDGTTPDVSYTYDYNGDRRTMVDGTGTTTWNYNDLGQLESYTDGADDEMDDTYDPAGNLAQTTYPTTPSGATYGYVQRTYDSMNRLASVTDWFGNTTSFAYDYDDNLTTETYPNGTTAAFTYDNADQLTAIDDTEGTTPLFSFNYAPSGSPLDGDGRVTSTADSISGNTDSYAYDQLGRVQSDAVSGAGTTTYTEDAAGAITGVADSGTGDTSTLSYDGAGELQEDSTVGSGLTLVSDPTYSYDDEGNRTQSVDSLTCSGTAYAYDEANRLTSVSPTTPTGCSSGVGPSASYSYDGNGLLTAEDAGLSGSGQYAWDYSQPSPSLAQQTVTSLGSTDTTEYIAGPDGLPVEQWDSSSGVSYYYQDRLGSTRALLDGSDDVQATYSYSPFGQYSEIGGDGAASTPLLYAGQLTDTLGGSGLIYLRARWYDPATMQFVSKDPLTGGTLQPYAYAGDDPLNQTDPSGMISAQEVLVGVGIGVAITGCVLEPEICAAAAGYILPVVEGAVEDAAVGGGTQVAATAAAEAASDAADAELGASDIIVDATPTPQAVEYDGTCSTVDKGSNIVYRGGSASSDNLTPRLTDLAGDPPGLSTWRTLEDALGENNSKAQAIDLNLLKTLKWIEEGNGHVTITPADASRLEEWASTRGTGTAHPFTQELVDAIVREVRRP